MLVAFDIDGCLIDDEDYPRWPVIDLLRAFYACGAVIIVWSGGGQDYAEMWVRRLGLDKFILRCWDKHDPNKPKPYLAIDDEEVDLGDTNWRIPLGWLSR